MHVSSEAEKPSNELAELRAQLIAAQKKIKDLDASLDASERRIKQLETDRNLPSSSSRANEVSMDVAPINEADVTLRRLVQRIAMASKKIGSSYSEFAPPMAFLDWYTDNPKRSFSMMR